VEATALLQHRIGITAVRALHEQIRPVLDVTWVDRRLHDMALSALLAASRRRVSLVDWVSFNVMRQQGIDVALALDSDFADQGFTVIP
jgi:predicted nucleic acid-binding protein